MSDDEAEDELRRDQREGVADVETTVDQLDRGTSGELSRETR